ncbi:hypothetical protein E0Z10_g8188 [Xylaria hypoxylon]|uniref:Uncharacterized protein n=1 Tax=Xylaria hypoxylon TaxID=37992 RepID=A0A4Z0YSW2_9PEZI|nr:hypothetical protein E0Z10_g8188 [Xylaria hypoxylon]
MSGGQLHMGLGDDQPRRTPASPTRPTTLLNEERISKSATYEAPDNSINHIIYNSFIFDNGNTDEGTDRDREAGKQGSVGTSNTVHENDNDDIIQWHRPISEYREAEVFVWTSIYGCLERASSRSFQGKINHHIPHIPHRRDNTTPAIPRSIEIEPEPSTLHCLICKHGHNYTNRSHIVNEDSNSLTNQTRTPSNLAARRPTFNIHQQHYSPAKSLAPKPLTSTFLAPPSPSKQPVNVALTAETSRLQTELLQLSLLHREAHAVSASWHASARSKFGARFKEIVAADQALQALEREGAETRGLQDLIRWGNASPEPSDENEGRDTRTKTQGGRDRRNGDRNKLPLDEKVQLLDQVLNGVWALGESGGRYERTMRAFEDWAFQVAEIRAAQRGGDIDGLLAHGGGGFELGGGEEEDVSIFVSDLDVSTWKRDHAGLVRMLEGWRRTLTQLGHVHANLDDEDNADGAKGGNETLVSDMKGSKPLSGLARTLRGCRILVRDMLAELNVMEQIELDALAAEEEWMEQMEARLSAEEEASDSRRRRTEDVPPWKLLTL